MLRNTHFRKSDQGNLSEIVLLKLTFEEWAILLAGEREFHTHKTKKQHVQRLLEECGVF